MFWKKLPLKVYLYAFFMVIALSAAFYLILGRQAKSLVTTRLTTRSLLFARAQANNLESYFQALGDSLAILSMQPTQTEIDAFVSDWGKGDLIEGVVVTNSKGKAILSSNVDESSSLGIDLSDKDYFKWAKNAGLGEHFVGALGVSWLKSGDQSVVVASPVFKNDVFTGVVAVSVSLDPLSKKFVESMKILDGSTVYLVSKDGKIIDDSSKSSYMGSSIFDIYPKIKESLSSENEGVVEGNDNFIAYSTASFSDQDWVIVTTSLRDEVKDYTTPIYLRLLILLGLVSVTLLLFGFATSHELQRNRL